MVALVSPGPWAGFTFHLIDLVRDAHREGDVAVLPEVERLADLRIVCLYGKKDENSLCPLLNASNRRIVEAPDTTPPATSPTGSSDGCPVSLLLSRTRGITVINAVVALGARQRSPTPKADSILTASTLTLVRQTRAGVVVTGSYFIDGQRLAVIAEVSETRSGRVLGVVGPLSIDTVRAEQGLAVLADSVACVVRLRFAPPDTSRREGQTR